MQLELIKKFKKNDFHLKYIRINSSLLESTHVWLPSTLLDASLSSYTYFFNVYVYTFTYCIGENCNLKKSKL